jgi:triacylglycerol lipase
MTAFVELPPKQYIATAFDGFDPAISVFNIVNARAMMWFSQLAYEVHKPQTIQTVGAEWGFTKLTPFEAQKIGIQASFDTRGIIGERDKAIVLAFGGTDPGVWEMLATDFNIRPTSQQDTHIGFQTAIDAVGARVDEAARTSVTKEIPLFIAGHSLGAALAALAAQRAHAQGATPKGVYTFGMPRTGGETFRAGYDATLGPITYRLVHGLDVVARVPPSEIGFRHVGRALQCDSGKTFDPAAPLSEIASDVPAFALVLAHSLVSGVEGFLSGHIFSPEGPGTFGPMFKFLPPPIRDHLQDRYCAALGAPIPPND